MALLSATPAPYVHNDMVYLYITHDEDGAEGFLMKDWLLCLSAISRHSSCLIRILLSRLIKERWICVVVLPWRRRHP